MKFKIGTILTLGLLTAAATYATPVNCAAMPPHAQTVDTYPAAGPSGYSISCGGLTFSDFEVVDAGSTLPAIMNLVSAVHDSALNTVVLNFNPNLFAWPQQTEDIHFYFKVSGGIDGIDLSVGGSNSVITERACSTAVNRSAGNNCTGGLPNQLAALTNFSGNSDVTSMFAGGLYVSPVYIYKDILVDGRRSLTGADLTSFSQSFHTGSQVPEPVSTALIGSGIVGLIALRRRIKA